MMTEHWNPVVGYESLYEVSDLGRIKSLDRVTSHGHFRKERILRTFPDNKGYAKIDLYVNGTRDMRKVHNLVLEAFVGERPKGMIARHYPDQDPSNNRLSNLSWDTYSQNAIDQHENGTMPTELCAVDVHLIRDLSKNFKCIAIARWLVLTPSVVYGIVRGRTWRHVEWLP